MLELLKKFSQMRKMALRKVFQHFLHANLFMFTLLVNHMAFLVQFEINLHLRVFRKAEIALASNFSFLTKSLMQITV